MFASELYLKASDASMRGMSREAVIFFKYLLKIDPNNSTLKKKYVLELIRVNQIADAEELLSEMFNSDKNKDDEGVAIILGSLYQSKDENKKSVDVYHSYLAKHPGSSDACLYLGRTLVLMKQYGQALKDLTKCRAHTKEKLAHDNIDFFLAKIHYLKEDKKSSLIVLDQLLKRNPQYDGAILLKGSIYEGDKKNGKAIELYEKAIKHNPNSTTLLTKLISLYGERDKKGDSEKILDAMEKISTQLPDDLNFKVKLALQYSDAGRFKDAKGILKEILVNIPTSDKILYYLGAICIELTEYEEAIEYFAKITNESELHQDASLQVVKVLYKLVNDAKKETRKPYEERFFAQIEKVKPMVDVKVELMVILAGYYETHGDLPKAIDALTQIKGEETFGPNQTFYLASLHDKNGNSQEAINIAETVLAKDPENPDALNFIGFTLLEMGKDMAKAYNLITKACKLRPKDGYIIDSLGWYYFKKGEFTKAKEQLELAFSFEKNDPVIVKHLAILYSKIKMKQRSAEFFRKAIDLSVAEYEKEEIIKEMEQYNIERLPASQPR